MSAYHPGGANAQTIRWTAHDSIEARGPGARETLRLKIVHVEVLP